MKGIKMGKTLYGGVEKNEFNYEQKAEPGACEVCQELDGTVYETSDEIPSKPHPNCKCWINLVQKESPTTTDPIEIRREQAKDRKRAQFELEKLLGDVKVLQDEVDAYVNDLEKYTNQIDELEEIYNLNNLKAEDKNKIAQTRQKIKINKNEGQKIANEINVLKNEIDRSAKSENGKEKLNIIHKTYFTLKTKAENYIVNNTPKHIVDNIGMLYSKAYNLSESFELYKIASKNYDNEEYIEKNGIMYESISQLNNKDLENEIRNRVISESKKNDCKVLVLNENSSLASKIMSDNDFKMFLKNNIENIRKKETLPTQEIIFNSGDTYNSLHGAVIKNIKFDNEGNLTMRIEDYYNFNLGRKSVRGRLGERLQNERKLENYYIIINIKIPKESI